MLKIMNRALIIASAAVLVTACSALQQVVKEPNVTVKGMDIKSVSLTDMGLDFILDVENPNPIGLSLSGISYKLDVEEKSLASGQSMNKMSLGANKSSTVHLPLQLNYQQAFGGIESLLKKDKINYALSGELDFGLFRLPYSKQGVIDMPSLPDVKVNSVNINGVTLSGLNVGIGLQVSNSNNFPIRLEGIDYGLKLANSTVASGKSLGALSLKPGETGTMNIGLNLGYGELGNVINALKSSSRIPVELDGQMKIPGAKAVPLNWQGEVGINR